MPRATRSYLPRYHREIVLSLLPTILLLSLYLSRSSSPPLFRSVKSYAAYVATYFFPLVRIALPHASTEYSSLRSVSVSAASGFHLFSPLFFLLFPGSIGFRRSCSRIGFYLRVSPREEWKNTWRTTFWERKRSREKERERGKEKNSPSFGPRGSRS